MLRYNRVRNEIASFPVFNGLVFPDSIIKIRNPFHRWFRKFMWQASTDGTKQHAILAILVFYLGMTLVLFSVFMFPEDAALFLG